MKTNLNFLNNQETKEIQKILEKQFGTNKIQGELIKIGKEKIFIYQGSLTQQEIEKISEITPIERIGIYFGRENIDRNNIKEIRLSIEGSEIIGKNATKNVFIANGKQAEQWMMGHEVLVESEFLGPVIIKYQNEFIGCGKASKEKITNFIPKSRRLKDKSIIK
jgi:NOL1/NOP2/fmu family ribosome biogenesis protein